VTHGAPAKVWALTCPACEDHLRSDPNWAVDALEIPETPDEIKLREAQEKRGEKTVAANLQASIASLATSQQGIQQLMTIMTAALANVNPAVADALTNLASDAASEPVMFGTSDNPTEPTSDGLASPNRTKAGSAAIRNEAVELDADLLGEVSVTEPLPDLTKLTVKDLRALARDRGLADTGNRAQLLERLNETS
jgi:hypothetical protein